MSMIAATVSLLAVTLTTSFCADYRTHRRFEHRMH